MINATTAALYFSKALASSLKIVKDFLLFISLNENIFIYCEISQLCNCYFLIYFLLFFLYIPLSFLPFHMFFDISIGGVVDIYIM